MRPLGRAYQSVCPPAPMPSAFLGVSVHGRMKLLTSTFPGVSGPPHSHACSGMALHFSLLLFVHSHQHTRCDFFFFFWRQKAGISPASNHQFLCSSQQNYEENSPRALYTVSAPSPPCSREPTPTVVSHGGTPLPRVTDDCYTLSLVDSPPRSPSPRQPAAHVFDPSLLQTCTSLALQILCAFCFPSDTLGCLARASSPALPTVLDCS